MADAAAAKVAFDLVTPTRLVLAEQVDMVVVPGADGDMGVLPGHTPLITTLRPGIVDVHEDGQVAKSLFVSGGFAEVTPERCTVLADSVETLGEITLDDARKRLGEAREALSASDDETAEDAQAAVQIAEALVDAVTARGH